MQGPGLQAPGNPRLVRVLIDRVSLSLGPIDYLTQWGRVTQFEILCYKQRYYLVVKRKDFVMRVRLEFFDVDSEKDEFLADLIYEVVDSIVNQFSGCDCCEYMEKKV